MSSQTTNTPYTYIIGWSKLNKYYYGVRYAKNCHPSDLWTKYFTSSSIVDDFVEMNGQPDIIQVRKTFTTNADALKWEYEVIKRTGAVSSDVWLNASNGGLEWANSEESAKKISDKCKQRWADPVERAKYMSVFQSEENRELNRIRANEQWNNPEIISKLKESCNSPEYLKGLSERTSKNWKDEEYRNKVVSKMTATINTPEVRAKKSAAAKAASAKRLATKNANEEAFKLNDPEGYAVHKKKLHDAQSLRSKKLWQKDEYRDKISNNTYKSWQDEETRTQRTTAQKQVWVDRKEYAEITGEKLVNREPLAVDIRENINDILSEKAKARYADPEFKAKHQAAYDTDEYKKAASERAQILKENPEHVAKHTASVTSPEHRALQSRLSKERMQDENNRKVISDALKKKCESPEYRALMSERAKASTAKRLATRERNKLLKLQQENDL